MGAEALVSKGLASVVRYAAGNDQRSSKYDELLMAEQKAEKSGKGMFDKKNIPTHRVSDMSGNPVKCKQFLPFLQRAGRMSGLVEFVPSGDIIKAEPFGDEANSHVKEMLLQREVEIEV